MPEPMYTLRRAAELLNVSERHLAKHAKTFKGIKVGRLWRFPRSTIDMIANRAKELKVKAVLAEEE